ncbi:hypothetical protein FZC66_09150 [Priestia megaterium]|nr:hypothetical protein FZC66_09150 [Priestia megaterium]
MSVLRKEKNKEALYAFIAFIFIFLYVAPTYIMGENAHIRVHDNLDSNIAWYKVLAESGQMFGGVNSTIPQVINGLPRDAYGSEFSGIVWLHSLFPSMTAYALSQTITRTFAFIGMYLLLKQHFIRHKKAAFIRVGVSLAFALTPFWPSGMLSTLGYPLALWAFLNIRSRNFSWKEWVTLALLPLYSSFVLGFFFFLVAIAFLWIYDLITKRDWNLYFLGSIVFMTSVFLLVEYRLVYSMVLSEVPTHRVEFISSRHELWRSIRLSFKNFLIGHTHVMTVHTFVILPIIVLALVLLIVRKKGGKEKLFIFLFLLNYALSLWYALWFNNIWIPLKEKIDFLNTFNFARFHFLRLLIIYLSFALACYMLWSFGRYWRALAHGAIVSQIVILLFFNEEFLYGHHFHSPSFQEFYAIEQFEEMKDYIGQSQESYRVASIGLHPAIAQYNGFYTLDTYNNVYPLEYKYKFRKIIAKELEKDKKLKVYFDEWGSRCYIFVAELGKNYEFRKNTEKKIKNLELNTDAFKAMGGRYFFSSLPIMNSESNNLILLKEFNHKESAWTIYLYEAK